MKSDLMKYSLSLAFLISAMLLAISAGSVSVPISEIIKIIGSEVFYLPIDNNVDSMYVSIVYDIRLPRVILAGLVGASLAIAGAAFQGLLRNPLADPYILGVSSGASVGAVSTLFFNISIPFLGMYTLPFFSILTALATIMIVLFFCQKN
ncbi:FecCD family ABC transporter permease [Tetragenococcus halophilus]|uniref:FecCD family ABC transporter permease n=1 Tax=Tetragenococcus halophilus TaxID=51669 RepID=UPI001F0A3EEB|nr:iron chelate uptake ABC transporter family permease subunit [Tetragenococcus halophilus]